MRRAIGVEAGQTVHAHQLVRAQRLISDRSCSVLSLDVFDTVLWRCVPRPTDVFGMLGTRLRRAGSCAKWLTAATFRSVRIAAEQRARQQSLSVCGEVSLYDIWREMPLSAFPDATVDELVRAEVEVEREITVVDLDIAHLAHLAEKNDLPIMLISDTYFTEDQLDHLLDRPELEPLRNARVFRSQQHGLDKASGLWEIALREIDKYAEQVLHIGDNETADAAVPAALGVRTVHYPRVDQDFTSTLEREPDSLDTSGSFNPSVHEEHGDFGLTTLRARVLRQLPAEFGEFAATAWRYGASVLGPVLAGFAEWVARKAHDSGISVLWCPMREGDLLSELVNNAARVRGLQVTARPIWLSRQVTSIAARLVRSGFGGRVHPPQLSVDRRTASRSPEPASR